MSLNNPSPKVVWQPQAGAQTAFLQCPVREALLEGGRGGGKMLCNDTEVPTPTGMVRHGDLVPGSVVFAEDGTPTTVLAVFHHKDKPCYKVTTSDGIEIIAGLEHLWKWRKRSYNKWKISDTGDIHAAIQKGLCAFLPTCHAVEIAERALPAIDPYVLGLLLGDATFTQRRVALTSTEIHLWPEKYARPDSRKSYIKTYSFPELRPIIESLGLLNKTSFTKFVPNAFKFSSAAVRLAVLQGLLDTDGTIDHNGKSACSFSSVSKQLADDVQFLACSLGAKATVTTKKLKHYDHDAFVVYIQPGGKFAPFRMERKQALVRPYMHPSLTRRIVSIEPVEPRDCTCIVVDHPSHTYLVTQGFVVTHNTDALIMDFAQHVGQGWGASWRGIIFRQTYKQLDDVISKTRKFFRQIWTEQECSYNKQSSTWTWTTGEELLLRQLRTQEDYLNYHGHEYPFLAFEELCSWHTPDLFTSMISTNRTSHPGVVLKIRATTNPFGPGMNWVKRRYQLPHNRNKILRNLVDDDGNPVHDRVSIFAPLQQNKILLAADPNYLRTIVASAPNAAARLAWTVGDWNVTAGGALDDIWMDYGKYFIIPPIYLPDNWKLRRSFDWGNSKPFSVGWFAESNGEDVRFRDGSTMPTLKGDLFRIAEWYGCKPNIDNEGLRMTATEIANGIIDLETEWKVRGRVRPGPADTNIFTVENGHCIADDMQRAGVRWLKANKGQGSRIAGLDKLRTLLKNTQRPREHPGLFITANCEAALRTLPTLPRDEKNLDDVDTEAEDHLYDDIRYLITFVEPVNTTSTF